MAALPLKSTLPFAFARRYGLFLRGGANETALTLCYRDGVSSQALAEVQRQVAESFVLEQLPLEDFEQALSEASRNTTLKELVH